MPAKPGFGGGFNPGSPGNHMARPAGGGFGGGHMARPAGGFGGGAHRGGGGGGGFRGRR